MLLEFLKLLLGQFSSLFQYFDKKHVEQETLSKKETYFQEEDIYKLMCIVLYKNHKNERKVS